ncbi:MAG: hypothetical protein JW717_03370 [Marinilabiliaceae bacterium]|nr:hypothetical protein [Marinilabiliaceae bacterium]
MEFQQEFEQWKETIAGVKTDETKLPTLPIDVVCSEAENLQVEAQKDKEQLIGAGLEWILVEELLPLSHALRYCQAVWMSEYKAKQESREQWNALSPLAYELRNDMLHHFSYAFRGDNNLMAKVSRIRQGTGHSDMIQDLVELSVLAIKNPEPLTAINYDVTLNDRAAATSKQMSELLAMANGDANSNSEAKQMRDKAFTLLHEKMTVVRECGQYVFWRNEERKAKYACDYNRK